jgi:hypothetical protein
MAFDPERILRILGKHDVDHIVVGGIAGVLHGSPMPTDDLDIVPALKKTNVDALATALNELGARLMMSGEPNGIKVDWRGKSLHRMIVDVRSLNLMTDYGQLDVIHRPAGTSGYQDLDGKAEDLEIDDVRIRVAALEDIIRSKQAVARDRDLEQLPTLRLLLESKKSLLHVGDEVLVPWELGEKRGTVVKVLGSDRAARALVRLDVDGNEGDILFPVRELEPVRRA